MFSTSAGMRLKSKPKDLARKMPKGAYDKRYHSPEHALKPALDFSGFPALA
jgi:hypothetical protein